MLDECFTDEVLQSIQWFSSVMASTRETMSTKVSENGLKDCRFTSFERVNFKPDNLVREEVFSVLNQSAATEALYLRLDRILNQICYSEEAAKKYSMTKELNRVKCQNQLVDMDMSMM